MTALNVAANAAMAGHRVCLISLEDPRMFVQWRIWARLADVNIQSMLERSLTDDERARLRMAAATTNEWPLYIEDGTGLTSGKIKQIVMNQHRTRKYELVIVDHLAHIREPGLEKYQAVTLAAENMESMVKEMNVANLILHQLNRETEKDRNAGPQLHHLRSSGDLEQLGRVILFLHIESKVNAESDPNVLTLRVAKNSHGMTGDLDLWCDLPRMFVGERKRVEF
jgi:replicative DNA helicase